MNRSCKSGLLLLEALFVRLKENGEGIDVISSFSARRSECFIEDDSARERNRRSGRRSLHCERSAIPNHLWVLLDDGLNYERRSNPFGVATSMPPLGGSWPSRTHSHGNRKRASRKEHRSAEIKVDTIARWARTGKTRRKSGNAFWNLSLIKQSWIR